MKREESDLMLARRAAAGQRGAQEMIFRRFFPLAVNFLARRGLNAPEAEEIAQETFVSVFEALPFFDGRSALSTWICGIARHELADYFRKRKIKTLLFSLFPGLQNLVSRSLGPEGELEKKELGRKIKKVFSLLTEGYALVLRLKYIEGFSVREIAFQLRETEKTIESRLTRARKAFIRVYAVIDQNS